MNPSHRRTPSGKLRARGAGVPFQGRSGEASAITDVAAVEVGYCTIIRGEGPLVVGEGPVRTGVTASLANEPPRLKCQISFTRHRGTSS